MPRPDINAGPWLPVATSSVNFDPALIEEPLTVLVCGRIDKFKCCHVVGLIDINQSGNANKLLCGFTVAQW